MRAPNWKLPFCCHMDASQLTIGATHTHIEKAGEYAVSYFSKRFSPGDDIYSANDRELLGLMYFLQGFKCYLGGSWFEVLTDSQVFHNFARIYAQLARDAVTGLLGELQISTITFVKRKLHVLGDVHSLAPHFVANNTSLDALTDIISLTPRPIWVTTMLCNSFSAATSRWSTGSYPAIKYNWNQSVISSRT